MSKDPEAAKAYATQPSGLGAVHSDRVDRFAGQARLEWWANQAICLEMYDIDITVAVDTGGELRATGRHTSTLDATQREGWDFLVTPPPRERGGFSLGRVGVATDQPGP
ncbi:hypothetical protein [Streptomyces fructofermentans]|uniref:Uncharacterized protein n=1 Tax=Streptomyces fructofermentans TaxID=152141 RepID=A0A918U5C9_9ACTN|nr:hypothetical protein [Streptomyces fructofermentans]GGX94334.1 hypothetical protein GCM10010515_71490 [Streptomyces fructofermentans]